jgi:tRNA1Val (adenine37-N6)-methyltransferase
VFYFVLLWREIRFFEQMKGKSFQFKAFTIYQDLCAMKVGTDAVLLGAWAQLDGVHRILDVGTGTGVIALLLVNRLTNASIRAFSVDAIDLDAPAVEQAAANVAASQWPDSVHVMQGDINTYIAEPYDTIFSNPPYYRNSPASRDAARDMARCCDTLTFGQLAESSDRLLKEGGTLQVVLPIEASEEMIAACALCNLVLTAHTEVVTKERKQPKRILMRFTKNGVPSYRKEVLYMLDKEGNATKEYQQLVGDFYLH